MQFQEVVILEKSLAVDEQMIPFKGPNSLKKYLSEKPEKWGKWFCCSSPNRSLRVKYPEIALCLPDVVKFSGSKGMSSCNIETKPFRKMPFTAQKRLGRGSYKENQDKDKPLFVTSWFDNKRVLVISSFIGEQPLGECEWFDHKLKRTIEVLQLNLYSFTMSTWLELTSLT